MTAPPHKPASEAWASASVGAWLAAAWPVWIARGLDRVHGGPVEALTLDGRGPAQTGFKRVRVLARQVYAFAQGALAGAAGAREACDAVFAELVERAWLGPAAGWARTLTPQGAPLDTTPDLYDHAFALFALAWRYRLTCEGRALELAHRTLDVIEARFRAPDGGFWPSLPAPGLRAQNPMMHLTEAALALAEASGEGRFRTLADELHDLFTRRLFVGDAERGGGFVPELFDADWRPVREEAGLALEPGHQFEWAWILGRHQALTGTDNTAAMRALVLRAERDGVDEARGWTRNAVSQTGAVLDGGSRTWPNTERIKGWVALAEFGCVAPEQAARALEESLEALFAWHLAHETPGLWRDAFDEEGRCVATTVPASTLYHLVLAFSEALRVGLAQ